MEQNQRRVKVIRTTGNRSPRGIRRLGQALIALAQAQAEAEAQAQAEAAAKPTQTAARTDALPEGDASRPPGDAT